MLKSRVKHMKKYFSGNSLYLIFLGLFSTVVLFINLKITYFRYHNFEFGKFDLGNMTQMVWNTVNGRFMYLTDYFGTDLPRWAMSHVDPIILLFVPVFILYQSPMALVVSQLVLVIFSSLIIYLIAEQELKNKPAALLLGLAYLFYPAVGFLTAWTGFHGVTAVIPFFLGAFYVYERMHKRDNFTRVGMIAFWALLILTMAGKEQLGLYVALYGLFIWLMRNNLKTGLTMFFVGVVWVFIAFFIIIPQNAHYRVEGFERFAQSMGINPESTRNVAKPNYFLNRYESFGDSYTDIAIGMITQPDELVKAFFGGDGIENLQETFGPVGFLPFAYPAVLIMALPDFAANYLTTASGVGTAEIYNHRISMIVPVLFISVIFAVGYLSGLFSGRIKKIRKQYFILGLSAFVLSLNIYTSFTLQNPVYLWFTQAVQKRIPIPAFAKTISDKLRNEEFEIGKSYSLARIDYKDIECAEKVISIIPDGASVSGPDYLGAHLSMRETYAIFPAAYERVDYVIVDIFARKIVTILDVNLTIVQDVVGNLIKDPDHRLLLSCGNLFVFDNIGPHGKGTVLPIQEKFEYDEKYDYEIYDGLYLVDYQVPVEVTRMEPAEYNFVYSKKSNLSLDGYYAFMTFVHKDTGELYQAVNLPSYGLHIPRNWTRNHYIEEKVELILPGYLDSGTYGIFVGVSDQVRSRNVYLGELEVY
jgi:uncharacterized membrane protein